MNEIVKSETTETVAVISESNSTQGKFYISIGGEGNGYDDFADTIEQAREIAVNLIADWDGFEVDPSETITIDDTASQIITSLEYGATVEFYAKSPQYGMSAEYSAYFNDGYHAKNDQMWVLKRVVGGANSDFEGFATLEELLKKMEGIAPIGKWEEETEE